MVSSDDVLSGSLGRATLSRQVAGGSSGPAAGQGIGVPDDEHGAAPDTSVGPHTGGHADLGADTTSSLSMSNVQSGLRLDELLREVQERLAEVVATRGRMQGLLDAVLAVASGLELEATLRRIVQAAVDLVDARYGALGVLGPTGRHLAVHPRRVGRGRRGPRWAACPKGRGCSASSSSASTRCGWPT